MHHLTIRQLGLILPYTKPVTDYCIKRSISISTISLQDGMTESKLQRDALHIDRPQTDNLLLSTDGPLLTEETLAKQSQPNYHKQNRSASEIQNVDAKLIPGQSVRDSAPIRWTPEEQRQLATTTTSIKNEHAVSFDEIPGPLSLRLISGVTKNLPVIGNIILMPKDVISPFIRLFDTYGDVVCLRMPFCGDIIVVQKPEHISSIYKQRSLNKLSVSIFDSLTEWHKRQVKRRFDIGLGVTPEIKEFLKETCDEKKIFWSPSKYHGTIEKTTDDLIERLYTIRDVHNEVSKDFHKELYTWGIECMMQTLFGSNLGFYKVTDLQTNVEAQRTLQSFMEATDALQKCESGLQLWRLYNTRNWEKLSNACDVLESTMAKFIRMSKVRLDIALKMMIENKDYKDSAKIIKSSLIKALMLSGAVQPEQLLTLCLDMMLLGVNASSTSLGFIMYHLSKCRTKQQRLFEEVIQVLPQKDSVLNLESLQDTPYLHACVTESLRLKHPIPYSLMRLNSNMVINKYFIPSGTYVMTANEVASLNEENFHDANKFKPERWLKHLDRSLEDCAIPLSEGTRSFLGRDWLHQQLAVAIAKIVRHFKIEYLYGEIKTNRKILAKPTKPFQFVFDERRN